MPHKDNEEVGLGLMLGKVLSMMNIFSLKKLDCFLNRFYIHERLMEGRIERIISFEGSSNTV